MSWTFEQGDCLELLRAMPPDSVDLVFGSPPYEAARLYLEGGENLGVARDTDAWVAWMVEVYRACVRVCKGLTAFVVEGQTRNYCYSAGPFLLAAELHRQGFNLRKPPIFHRVGIPGSGGPDWLRNDYEPIICVTRPGRLPWSDNTAMGHAPKWAPGGAMSYRTLDGDRVNVSRGGLSSKGGYTRKSDGTKKPKAKSNSRRVTRGHANGDTTTSDSYDPPARANPGNVIKCIVGGGVMGGDKYCSQNEAPFPEKLAEWFVLSFCPPGGTVLDPFSGSGTTAAVSVRHGRHAVGFDLRASQVALATQRLQVETPMGLFLEGT